MELNNEAGNQVPESGAAGGGIPHHYVVGLQKLVVLQIATIGLYSVAWFYLHWKSLKELHQEKIWPFWRAFFCPIFSYSMFKRFIGLGAEIDSPAGMALLVFVSAPLWKLHTPFYLLGVFTPLIAMALVQVKLNAFWQEKLNDQVKVSSMSGWNWVGVLAGLALWGLIGFGDMGELRLRYGEWQAFTESQVGYSIKFPVVPAVNKDEAGDLLVSANAGGCSFMLQSEALVLITEEMAAKDLQTISDKVLTSVKESELLSSEARARNIYDYKMKLGKEVGFARTVFNKNQFYKLYTSCAEFRDAETKKFHDKFADSFVFK